MIQFIEQNKDLIGVLAVALGGVFVFVKWMDSRNRELKEKRYRTYRQLIGVVTGKHDEHGGPNIAEQIAAAYLLLEYKEYHSITKKIFSAEDLSAIANERWHKHVLPHINEVLKEIG